jgi:hypothetical protein
MLLSLTLLAEDAKTARYNNISDCVVARAAKRVMKPEYYPLVGSSHIDIYNSNHNYVCLDCKLSRRFMLSEMVEMAGLNENRTIQVDIPEEYLL